MNMIRRERLTSETRALANKPHSGFMYVGRPSPWGNPFKIDADNNRADSVSAFEQYFWGQMQDYNPKAFVAFRENFLRAARLAWKPGFGITLLCYCRANEACHADVLVTFLKERSK